MNELLSETIRIHCKACGKRDVNARLREISYNVGPFGFTIGKEYYARCDECGTEMMIVGLPADQIPMQSADDLETHLIAPASSRGAVRAAFALVLCWFPVLGFWLALKAYRMNRDTHGFPKLISISALIVSTPFTLGPVIAIPIIIVALLLHLF